MDNETNFESLDEEQIRYALDLQKRLNFLEETDASRKNFLKFVQNVWPDFILGNHHKVYAKKLQDIASKIESGNSITELSFNTGKT